MNYAEDIRENLPFELWADALIQVLSEAVGAELDAVEAMAYSVHLGFLPGKGDDTVGILSLLERVFGLPVNPPGVALASRQEAVRSRFASRNDGSALATADRITVALRTSAWTLTPGPGAYTVTLKVPYSQGSYAAEVARGLVQSIIGAHLSVVVVYGGVFLVGISPIGYVKLVTP